MQRCFFALLGVVVAACAVLAVAATEAAVPEKAAAGDGAQPDTKAALSARRATQPLPKVDTLAIITVHKLVDDGLA